MAHVIVHLLFRMHVSTCVPNTTFEGEAGVQLFCVTTVPEYYSDDNIVAYTNVSNLITKIGVDCPENSCSQTDRCNDPTVNSENTPKYGANVIGNICACDYEKPHPDPDIQDGTGAITCVANTDPLPYLYVKNDDSDYVSYGETGALLSDFTPVNRFRSDYENYVMRGSLVPNEYNNVTYQQIKNHIPRAVYLEGASCSEYAPKCVGFHSNGKFGICQKVNEITHTDGIPIFSSGVDGGNAPGSCDCRGRNIEWSRVVWDGSTIPNPISYYCAKNNLTVYTSNSSPFKFQWSLQGYKFDDGITDDIHFTIPSGSQVQTKRISKTGTTVNGKPCGTVIPSPLESITLDSFCSLKPRSDVLHPDSDSYNQNISVILHGTAALCELSNKEYNGLVVFQRFRLGDNFWDDLKNYDDEDRDSYVLLLVLLAGVDSSLLEPSFHGSWRYPEVVYRYFILILRYGDNWRV